MKQEQDTIKIRLMNVDDIDAVYEIETQSFATPWLKASFHNELTQNHFAKYLVVEFDQKIIGYCGLWIIMDEAQVTNIAVLPGFRGNKIGETLLKQAIGMAKEYGAGKISLEVRVSNHIAQSLYTKLGFQPGGIRKRYYTDNGEDALVMWVNLK
ncbi:MAG: ribosomal protein S18-alanine N-acetyltransferase [Bacillota bacterium]